MWRLFGISVTWEKYYSSLQRLPKRLKTPVPFLVKELTTFRHYHIKTVLDLGCGVGRNSIYLAKESFDVVGIDVSESALKMANGWIRKERLANVALLRGTMTNLPFRDGCFGAVVSISVIHHALKKNIVKTIVDVHRILKKNGLFFTNLASVKDSRYGESEEVENNTFRILEAFEEKRFEELHHFFTKSEASEILSCFAKAEIVPLKDKPNYWKITAIK